jgi:hypothetical protein
MEINTGNQVRWLRSATKISEVKHQKEDTPGRQPSQTEEGPDYRISLSDTSQKEVGEQTHVQAPGQTTENDDLSEEEAARMAQQAAQRLSQANLSISNHAMQKAVDLFT